jgi:signal transduction histidine kinase
LLAFLGFISMNMVLATILGVVVLLLMAQSMRLQGARREAQVAASSLLEQEQLTALGRMVAGVAHELNTPLSAMSSSVGTQKKAAEMMDAAVAEMSAPGIDPAESLVKCEKALRALRASDEVVDLVISNCVIALAPDKQLVFDEIFRLLKPGGRLVVSDVVSTMELPESAREDMAEWAACIGGADLQSRYLDRITNTGFERTEVLTDVKFDSDQTDDVWRASLRSVTVRAFKPAS